MKISLISKLPLFLAAGVLSIACQSKKEPAPEPLMTSAPAKATDIHSNADPKEAHVKHLRWKATVDFDQQVIRATATWEIEASADADLITFDTKGLTIEKVQTDTNTTAEYRLSEPDAILGQALAVLIQPTTKTVTIQYRTNPGAEALQWLTAQQTAGKKQPFLFTQSQAILARSWVPCQDSPGIRFTYDAEVTVPPALLALMSASNPETRSKTGVYTFEMKQPIPSYLLALAVGDLSFKSISPRSGIYAESSVVGKAAWEFADLEKMIAGAEELYGAYQWERYDVLVLPPSFPFGGMENPRLTFATPTILSGDRSLTSLIAHELAHSWSGNLVTNATWNDFWLNEGFTVYFETRIMEKLYGRDYAEMLASLSLQELKEEIKSLSEDGHPADTKLKLNLASRNPDDGVTAIAYNKGYFFLRTIEEQNGRDKFDQFVKDYFTQNAFKVMTTEAFIPFIRDYYQKNYNITLNDALFEEWIFSEGLPNSCAQPKSTRFDAVDAAMTQWNAGQKIEPLVKAWTTHEWLHFINHLPDSLTPAQLKDVDALGHFTASGNAEIVSAWGVIAIRDQYTPAYPKIEDFLIHTGRRKFLMPLYSELIKTEEGQKRARVIYAKARPNYHFVAVNSLDKLLNPTVASN
jgi:aminopeptidase N